MAKKKQKGKIRTEFRKRYGGRKKDADYTRAFEEHGFAEEDPEYSERISGKGDLTRKRTVFGNEEDDAGLGVRLDVDEEGCVAGRVLSVHGLTNYVQGNDGVTYACSTRQLLKSLSTDQRHIVAAGDRVTLRITADEEGVIERIEPRWGVLSRTSRGKQHVIVANVDQLLIISSAAQPVLKPNLIDRFLVTAESAKIRAVICINKVDLVDPADLQPLCGVYGQMGYQVILMSATTGQGVEQMRSCLQGKQSVLAGQSGVGKSSLLNVIDPELALRVSHVSSDNNKGRHTTTTAKLIPLGIDGFVVDTPGIRQFQLWDVIPEEVAGFFRDIRPYVSRCRYPDCTHTHEHDCAVKDAVADGRIDLRRYESYCHIQRNDEA